MIYRLGFLAIVLFLGACTGKSASPDPSTLRIQISSEPVTLDPSKAEDGMAHKILCNLMDGLVGYDGEGKLENRLAKTYSVSTDGLKYRFELKEAKWSDGVPVTAKHFVDGIRRALSPETASKLGELLTPIRGARAFRSGRSQDLGVREEGGSLVIELEKPISYFIQVLTLPVASPIREDFVAQGGKWPESAPVTGVYRIASHQTDRKYVLEKNPHHPLKAQGPDRVELVIVQDESTALGLFERAQVDVLSRVPSSDYPRLKARGVLRTDPFVATYYLSFNTRKAPFSDRSWRRAIAGVIRREELAMAIATGETPARSWIPEGIEGYLPYADMGAYFAEDVQRVRADAAKKKQSLVAGFDSSGRNSLIMEKIQRDVKTGLGLELSLQSSDWKTYVRGVHADPPQIFRFGWLAPFMDPISHLQAFMTGNPNNYSGWSNASYDRLVDEIQGMPPGPEREKKILEAQRILVDQEAAVVPLYHYVQVHAVSPKLSGFKANPFGVIRFHEIRKGEANAPQKPAS